MLWDHRNGSYNNFNVLLGHSNAVLDCSWCDNDTIVTVSADKTIHLYDVVTGQRLRKWSQHHKGIINTCSTAPLSSSSSAATATTNIIATGSDDTTCCIWDRRMKNPVCIYETLYPILAVAITSYDISNPLVFTSGIDNTITAYDIRMERKIYNIKGHTDTITSLAIQPIDQRYLLSNSIDQTLKIWDIQPFVASTSTITSTSNNRTTTTKNRHVKTITGHKHNSERGLLKCCWSYHNNNNNKATSTSTSMVSAGSSDRLVHIWDEYTTEELYVLPGHKGCVNTVTFHPTDHNIIVSGGSDNVIFVGELS